MKKTIALLLGLMLVSGFALVACGEEATTEESTETTAAEATDTTAAEATETTMAEEVSDAIPWTEAGDYEEQEATITGEVVKINDIWTEKQIPKVLIVLGDPADPEGDHFNIVIKLNPDGTLAEGVDVDLTQLPGLVGMTVEVTGTVKINSFESVYEIFLTDNDDPTLVVGEMEVVM